MANEYLQRTPTSTGNRRVFTWTGWIKRNSQSSSAQVVFSGGASGDYINGGIAFGIQLDNNKIQIFAGNTGTDRVNTSALYRDSSSWIHICVVVDTTSYIQEDRFKLYVNGVLYQGTYDIASPNWPFINYEYALNMVGKNQAIGASTQLGSYFTGQFTDVFLVDGQALTPDVFGFYKEGKGYVSAGSTQSTDFRPGQWVPKAPRTIKTEINRRGGFGVNGFYLPMNDSSNFGADFHTTPNSIITLKGENLPQPRNGAPTTTDAYVSQLREDPYKDYLVYAVPGISTSTSANIITNGNFDSNISGWTTVQATTSWQSGVLRIIPNSAVNGAVYQSITTEVGKRYTVAMEVVAAGAAHARLHVGTSTDIDSVDKYTYTSGTVAQNVGAGKYSASFTPTTTTTIIWLEVGGGAQTQVDFDNVVVKQEDAPRDYSADIKGSGTNKTITAGGNAGIGYELGNYYGTAIELTGSGFNDYIETPHSTDFNFGSGDFTIECWRYLDSFNTGGAYLAKYDGTVAGSDWYLAGQANGVESFFWYNGPANTLQSIQSSNNTASLNQWDHIAACRKGNQISLFVNGVCVGTATTTISLNDNTEVVRSGADASGSYQMDGRLQDLRIYKGVAKYKGGFDVPKPYTPVGISTWRAVPDTCQNNFATLNSIDIDGSLVDGNLKASTGTSGSRTVGSTFGISSGKYYTEFYINSLTESTVFIGVVNTSASAENPNLRIYQYNDAVCYSSSNGNKIIDGTSSAYGATYTNGDLIGVSINLDTNEVTFFKNGTSQGTITTKTFTGHYEIMLGSGSSLGSQVVTANFGQNPTFSGNITAGTYTDSNGKGLFKYQPPSGFLALCEDNLPTPAIANPGKYFKTVLWTGVNDTVKIKCGFQPDFVWIKNRDYVNWHALYDSIRGPYLELNSNETSADRDRSINDGLRSFDSDGFTSGGDDNSGGRPGDSYVAWCWKAGGAAVSNTDGSVTSQVSVNQDAGFSIVSYTGSSSAITVGHELGKKPNMILFKNRDQGDKWAVYHSSVGATKFLSLNETTAATTASSYFNDTEPTSSVFTVNQTGPVNQNNERYIAYCWTEIENFSKFGSYVANGSADGTFVYLGFKPAWVMIKCSNVSNSTCTSGGYNSWGIYDSSRDSSNPAGDSNMLWANRSYAEGLRGQGSADSSYFKVDLLSNGFKIRGAANCENNSNGATYIFAAFAESPFTTANAK